MSRSPLAPLANPSAIALFGASPDPDTIGGGITRNLLDGGFRGRLHLINPRHREIGGHPCHPSLADTTGPIDLALIATPAASLPEIIEQCGGRRVKTAVVYSAGFAETGPAGAEAEARLLERARHWGIRLLGPRSLGFIRPHLGLNATPLPCRIPQGNLAFVSQSGAICTGVMDWAFNEDFSLSAVFVPGNGCDLNLPEILDLLAADPYTESILLYLEGIRDSRRFMSALRAAARAKPVVVVKAGHAAAAATEARNQAPAGEDDAFDAALRRAGALRVRSIGDLFSAARALISPRRPRGNRLAVVTNGGGPAIMAADAAAECGVSLPALSPATVAALQAQLPHSWSVANPVDILIRAEPERFATAIGTCLADPEIDAALAIVSPNGLDPAAVARAIIDQAGTSAKPLLVCCMGEATVRDARHLLAAAGLPVFRTPESAVTAFAFMVDFVRNQKLLLETPPSLSSYQPPAVEAARQVIDAVLAAGRLVPSDGEAGAVLAAFHIPFAPAAAGNGLLVRIRTDRSFGPVIAVGPDGSAAGIPGSAAIVLPPLNDRLIGDLFREAPVARLLSAEVATADPLRRLLLRVSELASELPSIEALDLSIRAGGGQDLAVTGARMLIQAAAPNSARYPHMAICPYPMAIETRWQTRDGTDYCIRPIRPEDADAFQEFVRGLSERSKYYRFFSAVRELPPQQLARRTQVDYDREMVLVAVSAGTGGQEKIVAEANYGVLAGERTGEFGVVVADRLAGQGMGSRMMRCLMDAARARGLTRLVGEVLSDNEAMQAMMSSLGFNVALSDDPEILELSKQL